MFVGGRIVVNPIYIEIAFLDGVFDQSKPCRRLSERGVG